MNKKLYLVVMKNTYSTHFRFASEDEIKDINKDSAKTVDIYKLASDKPLSKEKAKKLGLKI